MRVERRILSSQNLPPPTPNVESRVPEEESLMSRSLLRAPLAEANLEARQSEEEVKLPGHHTSTAPLEDELQSLPGRPSTSAVFVDSID